MEHKGPSRYGVNSKYISKGEQSSSNSTSNYKYNEVYTPLPRQSCHDEKAEYEEYAAQKSHFIGTGLFFTNQFGDLPPRFKKKCAQGVIAALEQSGLNHSDANNMVNGIIEDVDRNRKDIAHGSRERTPSQNSQSIDSAGVTRNFDCKEENMTHKFAERTSSQNSHHMANTTWNKINYVGKKDGYLGFGERTSTQNAHANHSLENSAMSKGSVPRNSSQNSYHMANIAVNKNNYHGKKDVGHKVGGKFTSQNVCTSHTSDNAVHKEPLHDDNGCLESVSKTGKGTLNNNSKLGAKAKEKNTYSPQIYNQSNFYFEDSFGQNSTGNKDYSRTGISPKCKTEKFNNCIKDNSSVANKVYRKNPVNYTSENCQKTVSSKQKNYVDVKKENKTFYNDQSTSNSEPNKKRIASETDKLLNCNFYANESSAQGAKIIANRCDVKHQDQTMQKSNQKCHALNSKFCKPDSKSPVSFLPSKNLSPNSPQKIFQSQKSPIINTQTSSELKNYPSHCNAADKNVIPVLDVIKLKEEERQRKLVEKERQKKLAEKGQKALDETKRQKTLAEKETEKTLAEKETEKTLAEKESLCLKASEKKSVLKLNVSDDVEDLTYWENYLRKAFTCNNFSIQIDCVFTQTLSVVFNTQDDARQARIKLLKLKAQQAKYLKVPYLISVSPVKYHMNQTNNTKHSILDDCHEQIMSMSERCINSHKEKISVVRDEYTSLRNTRFQESIDFGEEELAVLEKLHILDKMQHVFIKYVEVVKKDIMSLRENANIDNQFVKVKTIKTNFSRECNCLRSSLPIYSEKNEILDVVRNNQVSVIIAETGSGKSTQLVKYFLQAGYGHEGLIICTQPRKIAAISITEYVSGQMGSPVGHVVGYDVGIEKKVSDLTNVIFMTDYNLLKKCIRNLDLCGISCIIIDEAHERTLYTDLLLAMVKKCIAKRHDIRIVITSATINPDVFKDYFNLSHKALIKVPGRTYPVKVVWLNENMFIGGNYVEACVKCALKVHTEEKEGSILVFLTSPNETEEAMNLFKQVFDGKKDHHQPQLICLHGKLDTHEQMLIFRPSSSLCRKIIFATNSAETSITIPGIKYVIDSGMVKEMSFNNQRNKCTLTVTFISKSSAEQRKGRAGRNEPGVCYRMYSQENFENMADGALPEILKTNIQMALLKILDFGFTPENFDFVQKPSEDIIIKSLDSLECMGAIENGRLTDLGRKIVCLPLEPRLGKLVLNGILENMGYEAIIIAALVTISGKIFLRRDVNKVEADRKKIKFCKAEGDFSTFLEVFKQWKTVERNEKSNWCAEQCINSKGMKTASSIVNEIICVLKQELHIHIPQCYNDTTFKTKCENILFECFSENLCIFSGHHKYGYVSPYLTESFFIHPSSSLCYLESDTPTFIVSSTVLKTSRNFLLEVMPIKEETITKAYHKGTFRLQVDMLKNLQILPKVLGPFGESVLVRYILGKQGLRLVDLESKIKNMCKTESFYIDVVVQKGEIKIYIEKRFHEKVSHLIYNEVKKAHMIMGNEDDIQSIAGCPSYYFSIGSGGVVSDIIMPGEFRELVFEDLNNEQDVKKVTTSLKKYGPLHRVQEIRSDKSICLSVIFVKVADAQSALLELKCTSRFTVNSKVNYSKFVDKSLPLYRIQVLWCRIPCQGTGWIKFFNSEDCIEASGILTTSSIYVGNNYIQFTPGVQCDKELYMKNLPDIANAEEIKMALQKHIPYLKVKTITLIREKAVKVSESDITSAKKQLFQIFGKYTPANMLVIDVKYPNTGDIYWDALVCFKNIADGEQALTSLKDRSKIGNYALTLKQVLKSSLYCKTDIYETVKRDIHVLAMQYKKRNVCTQFDVKSNVSKKHIVITFTCEDIKNLNDLRQQLMKVLQGQCLPSSDDPKYNVLFTRGGQLFLKGIQENLKLLISVNLTRKTIFLYGLEKACSDAKAEIASYVAGANLIRTKVFNLQGVNMPSGFLKALYKKYGFELRTFIDKFSLKSADINIHQKILTLKGTKINLHQAEEHLEGLCAELYLSKDAVQESEGEKEFCPICFDTIFFDYQRLEHCGHTFCKSCLLLQLESRIIPLICVKEGCDKPLFVEDIKRILSHGTGHLKDTFYASALQHHIHTNRDTIRYCPSPDCQMIYRVSKMSDGPLKCPECENDFCAYCCALYHHGMTCNMFQNCQKDEDYALKVWMKEDKANRKICPSCQTVIEKIGGCNHIECISCKTHLCWYCLSKFPSSAAVYDHTPLCTQNV